MKVINTLTLLIIILTSKTLVSPKEFPVFYIYINAKPKCLCPNDQVELRLTSIELKHSFPRGSCENKERIFAIIGKSDLTNLTLAFQHTEGGSTFKTINKMNVNTQCSRIEINRAFFFYEYTIYDFTCDESKIM